MSTKNDWARIEQTLDGFKAEIERQRGQWRQMRAEGLEAADGVQFAFESLPDLAPHRVSGSQ